VQEDQGSATVEELERDVEQLRANLGEAEADALKQQAAIVELEERQAETAGRLALAEGQAAELRHRLELREAELEEAQEQALYDAFLSDLADRDAAAFDAAARLDGVVEALAELDRQRAKAEESLERVPERFEAGVPEEPQEFRDAWERLIAVVGSKLDKRLDEELLEAAVRSPNGFAISNLPPHLKEAARQRRRREMAAVRAAARNSTEPD
jgi:hypothetical protein